MANSPSGESVVERIVRLLDAFSTRRSALTIAELSRLIGLPRTTTHRLCHELAEAGLLDRREDGRFQLGRRLWELGTRGSSTSTLTSIALPYMEDVHAVVRQHTTLGVLDDGELLYLHRLSSHSRTKNITSVAGRLPIHACSSGLVLLAHAGPEVVDEVLSRPLRRYTDMTITDPKALRRLLAEIRMTGYASVPGIITPESTGIAVPVFSQGRALAAVNVIVQRGEEDLHATVPALKTAAEGIARAVRDHPAVDEM